MEQSDQHFSNLFEGYNIVQPLYACKSCQHHQCRLCINKKCVYSSLTCQNPNCEVFKAKHPTCNTIAFQQVTTLLKNYFKVNRDFLSKMFEAEDDLFRQLTSRRAALIKQMSLGNFQEKYAMIVDQVYRKNNGEFFRGKSANEFLKKLANLENFKYNNQIYLQKFAIMSKRVVDELAALKHTIIKQYSCLAKVMEDITFKGMDSLILKMNGEPYQENLKFIYESLQNPRGLQLLYRGSEHVFDAKSFHEKCDNIEQTFTIIRTRPGKTIAGYNHLKWNTAQLGYLIDVQKKCFLLSLDLKQKMTLTNYKAAVHNNETYGPTFGGGNDIYICNRCHQIESSFAIFPHSYNLPNNPYIGSQATYAAFSGVTNGYRFFVDEYEVYRVIR